MSPTHSWSRHLRKHNVLQNFLETLAGSKTIWLNVRGAIWDDQNVNVSYLIFRLQKRGYAKRNVGLSGVSEQRFCQTVCYHVVTCRLPAPLPCCHHPEGGSTEERTFREQRDVHWQSERVIHDSYDPVRLFNDDYFTWWHLRFLWTCHCISNAKTFWCWRGLNFNAWDDFNQCSTVLRKKKREKQRERE